MSETLYEYYNTGDTTNIGCGSVNQKAQTFTPSVTHKITSVKLKLWRSSTVNTIYVDIHATSAGLPTGSSLASITMAGSSVTTSTPGEWYEFAFGANPTLTASTQYAIVVRAQDDNNNLLWRIDDSSPTYSGGETCQSTDSGSSWSNTGNDAMFEEYGIGLVSFSVSDTVTTNDSSLVAKGLAFIVSETLSLTEAITNYIGKVFSVSDTMSLTESITTTIVQAYKNIVKHVSSWINQDKTF